MRVYARFFPRKNGSLPDVSLFQAFNSELTWKNTKSTWESFKGFFERGALDSTVDLSQSVFCNRLSNYYFWFVVWSSVESLQGKHPGSCLTCRHWWAGASKLSAGAERRKRSRRERRRWVSRARRKEAGDEWRKRVVDEKGSLTRRRVESFYRSSAQPTWLSHVHAILLPFRSVSRFDLPPLLFFLYFLHLINMYFSWLYAWRTRDNWIYLADMSSRVISHISRVMRRQYRLIEFQIDSFFLGNKMNLIRYVRASPCISVNQIF